MDHTDAFKWNVMYNFTCLVVNLHELHVYTASWS